MTLSEKVAMLDGLADIDCGNDDGNHEWFQCPYCYARHAINDLSENASNVLRSILQLTPHNKEGEKDV